MEIKTYIENELNVKELWLNGVLKGRELTPIITPQTQTEIPQPTNQELLENQLVIMNGLADIYIAQLGL